MSFIRAPFLQRRLTKLYSDTKSSYENITKGSSKTNDDPALLTIQRDFRTQKDRLLAWGLDWSDASAAQPQDIDVSLNQAGFSEVVAGVMSTIQELLSEAERLQDPYERRGPKLAEVGIKVPPNLSADPKRAKSHWTPAEIRRSKDLLKELKSAIDTLYELSRCRSVSRSSHGDGHDRKKSAAESIKSFKSIAQGFDPKTEGSSKHSLEIRNPSFVRSSETLKSLTPSLETTTTFQVHKTRTYPSKKAPSVSYSLHRRSSIGTLTTISSFKSAPVVPGPPLQQVSEEAIEAAKNWNDKSFSMHSLYIDRKSLDLSYADKAASNPPPYEVVAGSSEVRQIGTLPLKAVGIWKHYANPRFEIEKSVPVLVEFVPMTSGFKSTGLLLPHDRLAEIARALRRVYQARRSMSHLALLGFLGYFVDLACSRYAFVYLLPAYVPIKWSGLRSGVPVGREEFEPKALEFLFSNPLTTSGSKAALGFETPGLEDRFELAYRLGLAVLHLRYEALVHGQINNKNIFFLPISDSSSQRALDSPLTAFSYNVKSPYLTSFSQFSETGMRPPPEELSNRIYRHPNDQRNLSDPAAWAFDLYSLGLVLLEIALWIPIEKLWKPKYDNATFKSRIQQIYLHKVPSKCGTLYTDVIKLCLEAPDLYYPPASKENLLGSDDLRLRALYQGVLTRDKSSLPMSYVLQVADKLHRCCALNDDFELNDPELEMFRTSRGKSWLNYKPDPILEEKSGHSRPGSRDQNETEAAQRRLENEASIEYSNDLQKNYDALKLESESQKLRIEELEKELAGSSSNELPPSKTSERVELSAQAKPQTLDLTSKTEEKIEPAAYVTKPVIVGSASSQDFNDLPLKQSTTEAEAQDQIFNFEPVDLPRAHMSSQFPDPFQMASAILPAPRKRRVLSPDSSAQQVPSRHPAPTSAKSVQVFNGEVGEAKTDRLLANPASRQRQQSRKAAILGPTKAVEKDVVISRVGPLKSGIESPSDLNLDSTPRPDGDSRVSTKSKSGEESPVDVIREPPRMEKSSKLVSTSSLAQIFKAEAVEDSKKSDPVADAAPDIQLPSAAGPSSIPKNHTLKKWAQLDVPQASLDSWNKTLMARLNVLLQKALKDSPESCSASVMMVGNSPDSAKPTICVTCSSVGKVRAVLKRYFQYNSDEWGLIVIKGDIRRSKQPRRRRRRTRRSKEHDLNPFYQKRPLCGASIGAFRDNEHLPPVSYGGAILVDDVPYGMTVHHMLDAPSDDESDYEIDYDTLRSAGPWTEHFDYSPGGFQYSPFDEDPPEALYPFEIVDDEYDEDTDDSELSDFDDLSEDARYYEDYLSDDESVGDTFGISPGEDDQLVVTQPAIDDVEDEYFPDVDEKDEEHLTSHSLGYVHASSGVRRWTRNGIKHEVDWALIRIADERLETQNVIPQVPLHSKSGRQRQERPRSSSRARPIDARLEQVANLDDLRGLNVHCCGRTSGLQRGRISTAMTLVKMHGRRSFSSSWCVDGNFGVPGDSGAWVFNKANGLVCGHVLAYCAKTMTAYIAPMQVLFEDIARTLGASSVTLPCINSCMIQTLDERPSSRKRESSLAKGKQPDLSIPDSLSTELSRLSLRREDDFVSRSKDVREVFAGIGGGRGLEVGGQMA